MHLVMMDLQETKMHIDDKYKEIDDKYIKIMKKTGVYKLLYGFEF